MSANQINFLIKFPNSISCLDSTGTTLNNIAAHLHVCSSLYRHISGASFVQRF